MVSFQQKIDVKCDLTSKQFSVTMMATQTLSIDNYQDGQQVRHFPQKFI